MKDAATPASAKVIKQSQSAMGRADTILYIEHYAGSPVHGMEFRPYYMAKRWVRMGFRVIIVAASFSHVRRTNPKVSSGITKETLDGITYLWLRTPRYSGSGWGRVTNMVVFVCRLFRLHRRLARLSALRAVIASSTYPLDIYPAYLIARRAHAQLIFEVHDLWPLSPVELGGYSRYHPFILVMQHAENFAYRKSHRVVSVLPKTLPHMARHGLAAEKFAYIPNGIDPEEIRSEPQESTTAFPQIPAGKFIVGYAGTLGIANSLDCLLQAAEALREVPDIHFVIIGGGPEAVRLTRLASERSITNLTFLPPVSKSQAISVMKRFDICYLGLKRSSLYRFGISPNKLFDYMYAGRPILQALEAGNDIVHEAGCGLTVEPDNPRAVADAVMRFYRMTPQKRSAMGEKGRQFVLANHTYDRLAGQFSALFADGDSDRQTNEAPSKEKSRR